LAEVGGAGIEPEAVGVGSSVAIIIVNSGDITNNVSSDSIRGRGYGNALGENSDASITITNTGLINNAINGIHGVTSSEAAGTGSDAGIVIVNENTINVTSAGIRTRSYGAATGVNSNAAVYIRNEGLITAGATGILSISSADAYGADSTAGITILNAGALGGGQRGIEARSSGYAIGADSDTGIAIVNEGAITVLDTGILADTTGQAIGDGSNNGIAITNETAINAGQLGIYARTTGYAIGDDSNAGIAITNEAAINAGQRGIYARTTGYAAGARSNKGIAIANDGVIINVDTGILAVTTGNAIGIDSNAGIAITNEAAITASRRGIDASTTGDAMGANSNTSISVTNEASLLVDGGQDATVFGIYTKTEGIRSHIVLNNDGDIAATSFGNNAYSYGLYARTYGTLGDGSRIELVNRGEITSMVGDGNSARAYGIWTGTGYGGLGTGSTIELQNSGNLAVSAGNGAGATAFGIVARTNDEGGRIDIENRGDLLARVGMGEYALVHGIYARTARDDGTVYIHNRGDIAVLAGGGPNAEAYGIWSRSYGAGSGITIVNSGDAAVAAGNARAAIGIAALTYGPDSPIVIDNSASIFGGTAGISTFSYTATTIVNSGDISAASLLAIDAGGLGASIGLGRGASVDIFNTGRITGFVNTTDEADTFLNLPGGVFETKLTSDFGGGGDLFRNEAGATILAATNPREREFSSFINLNRFESQGLIALQDGEVGDVFEISNTVGGRDLTFTASGNSTLAVDAFLGAPGSTADNLIINGNVTGRTPVTVNNTNPGPGAANTVGIPVVFVEGKVKSDAFFLPQPIDTGLFIFDMFFEPTGSGIFELRTLPGPSAVITPQIITGAQDIWYLSASTWFDRTADLRVFLNGGAAPAYDPNSGLAEGMAEGPIPFTPAVWVRGSGSWLDRDGRETVNAFGRAFRFDLDRDLDVIDFQTGLDLGKRDFLATGDILVFGMLGGFVDANLDYKQLNRAFDFSGGQVGGFATYLNGGLFVDTLLNVHLLELETATLGFPNSLDATTVGLRTDSGYRFGGFRGGPFIEPLATLLVTWVDVEGFRFGPNRVSFGDDANLRGRLGLRVGTSTSIWGTTTFEPFVIGSLWGHLDGDSRATLVSNGTTFRFEDQYDEVWGEVSAGVNFFNVRAGTSVFAKLDVIFGDDVDGLSGKAGMRVFW